MQIMIIYYILETDKHEHKRLILHFKAQPFFFIFKEMSYSLRSSMRHNLVGYKVLINIFMATGSVPNRVWRTIRFDSFPRTVPPLLIMPLWKTVICALCALCSISKVFVYLLMRDV